MGGCSMPKASIWDQPMCRPSRSRGWSAPARPRRCWPISSIASATVSTGGPTLLIIDEGWLALDDDAFAEQLREWLKTLRKKNASVIFATQSLSDIDGSHRSGDHRKLPDTPLLPNERAIEPQITSIYRRFGLNDRQIEILARATPKRDYYCQSRRGNRLFELGLSEVGLALCAASSKSDQARDRRLVAEHGRDGFLAAWLKASRRRMGGRADPRPQQSRDRQRPTCRGLTSLDDQF
jgi:type IV secretory pathway VirB4 component